MPVIRNRYVDGEVVAITAYTVLAVSKAVGKALGGNAHAITNMVYESVNKGVPDRLMLRANTVLAESAQRAVVSGWRSRLPLRSAPYRKGPDPDHDRLSGKLGEALADESMLRYTTPRGISFLNVQVLNSQARHWYRVNYGAFGPRANPNRPKAYPITVDGHTVMMLQDEHQPSANSWLPRRFMFEGRDYFTPLRGPADVHGGGHRSALFTDLGFQSIAKNVNRVYGSTFRTYVSELELKQQKQLKPAKVVATDRGVH
jgi:hypothetical protein